LYLPAPAFYQWVLEDINNCERRISRSLFEDLFLLATNIDRSNVTAREIAEKHEEKLLQLGPVLLRQNDEHYDPLIDMTFEYMAKNRIIPKPPQELRDMDLGVEYISILSQAMKLVGVGSIERFTGYVGNLAAVQPNVLDLFDADAAVIEYGNVVGAPPKLTRDKRVVADMRAEKAKQAQAAQMGAMVQPAAETVKTLADAKIGEEGDSALTRLFDQMTAQAA
jgi:hypothetical protein